MRLSKTTWLLAAGGMTLGVFGVAAAQTGAAAPAASGQPQVAAIQAPREIDLPPDQQLALARQFVGRMEQSSTAIRAQLEQARSARDVVKSLCLNDKLNQINVAKRSAADRLATLQAAADANDKDRAKHEFMLMQELRDRADQIVKEANQCIGEEAGFIGETEVSLDVDPNIPDNDPDQLGVDPDIISEPPVESSPRM
jgi:hypothetical protein